MKQTLCVFFLAAAWFAGGCAYYKIQPVPAASLKDWGESNGPREGYIFYQPELYFSATILTEPVKAGGDPQVKQTVTVVPLYLPNYQKPFRMTTWDFMAKSDFTFTFEDGWKLTQISDKADNSAVANTLAGQLQTILSAAKGTGPFKLAAGASNTRVILYRPIFDKNGYLESFKEVGSAETK